MIPMGLVFAMSPSAKCMAVLLFTGVAAPIAGFLFRRVGGGWRIVFKNLVAATLGPIADKRKRGKLELQRIDVALQAELPALGRGLAFPSGAQWRPCFGDHA